MGVFDSGNHDSPVGNIGKKGQKYTDPLAMIFGDKFVNLTSVEIPRMSNTALSKVMKPFEKVDKTINPVRRYVPGVDKIGNVVADKPASAIGTAVGAAFTGGAALGAMGGGGGAAGAGAAGAAEAGGGAAAAGGAAGGGGAAAAGGGAAAGGVAGGSAAGYGGGVGSTVLPGIFEGGTVGGGSFAGEAGAGAFGGSASTGSITGAGSEGGLAMSGSGGGAANLSQWQKLFNQQGKGQAGQQHDDSQDRQREADDEAAREQLAAQQASQKGQLDDYLNSFGQFAQAEQQDY